MKVQDIMVQPVVTTKKDAFLNEVAALMIKHQIGCVPVVEENGKMVGVITETDFMPRFRNLPFSTFRMPHLFGHWIPMEGMDEVCEKVGTLKAEDIMSKSVLTTGENDLLDDLVEKMIERKVNHVPVVRDNKIVGMVTRHDMLRAYLKDKESQAV